MERVDVVRDLGVYLDSRMLLTYHIDTIVLKAYRSLGFVLRVCKAFKNIQSLKIVYYAYVRSVLEYASSAWSPCYITHSDKIEKIKKLFLKHLNFKIKSRFNYYIDNCRHHGLLTLGERRTLSDMCLLYDILRGRLDCPELLAGIGLWVRRRTEHVTRAHTFSMFPNTPPTMAKTQS